jgi:hypothetical protein
MEHVNHCAEKMMTVGMEKLVKVKFVLPAAAQTQVARMN